MWTPLQGKSVKMVPNFVPAGSLPEPTSPGKGGGGGGIFPLPSILSPKKYTHKNWGIHIQGGKLQSSLKPFFLVTHVLFSYGNYSEGRGLGIIQYGGMVNRGERRVSKQIHHPRGF